MVWNVPPEIFRIGPFAIRWYSLCFALSFIQGYMILAYIFKKEEVSFQELDNLTIYMFLGTVLGARFGHVLFYQPGYYLSHPLEIIEVWKGGLASHGAATGILISLYLFSKRVSKKSFWWISDRVAIVIALGAFFIRVGNLMNSEIIGKPTDVPWAFIFKSVDEIPRHPSQLYEGLSYLLIFFILIKVYLNKKGRLEEGLLSGLFLIGVFTVRFIIEFFKEVQVPFERYLPLDMGQLLSIPLIVLGIVILVWSRKQAKDESQKV